jgi:hypothetical protein
LPQSPSVGVDHALPVSARDGRGVLVPFARKHPAHLLGHPVDARPRGRAHGAEDESPDSLRVGLGVHQTKRRSPGQTDHQPLFDMQVLAQRLDVADQRGRRVGPQVCVVVGDERPATAAAALVDADHPEALWICPAAVPTAAETAARAAVQVDHRTPGRVAGSLPVDFVVLADRQQPADLRLDPGEHVGSLLMAH